MPCQRAKFSTSLRSEARGLGFSSSVPARSRAACSIGTPRARAMSWIWRIAGLAQPALGRVDDALEGEVVGGLRDDAEIGHRVADLHALVEARAADDAVVEAQRDEAVLELAHLEGRAHQDRHVVQDVAAPLGGLDLLADGARLFFRIPGGVHHHLGVVGVGGVGEQRLAEPALIVGDEVRGSAQYMRVER